MAAGIMISGTAQSQIQLHGAVMDSRTDVPIQGATIYNRSRNIYRRSTPEGKYSIMAKEGDTIMFSSAGYRHDTVTISEDLLTSGFDIGLKVLAETLDTVQINARSYAEDSMQRRSDYKDFYAKPKPGITGGNTSEEGFGVSVSPLSFFYKNERAERRFRKQLKYNEEQAYIDHYFSASYVHKLTRLDGDELYHFMLASRPSYKFVRKASPEDLLNYVNNAYKAYQKKK